MIELFNGWIQDVLSGHHSQSGEDLEQTLLRDLYLKSSQLPQSVIKGRSPINALMDWQCQRSDLFMKRVYDFAGCDTYVSKKPPQCPCGCLCSPRDQKGSLLRRSLHLKTLQRAGPNVTFSRCCGFYQPL